MKFSGQRGSFSAVLTAELSRLFQLFKFFLIRFLILGGQQGGAGVNGGQKKADVTKEMLDKQLDQYMQSSS